MSQPTKAALNRLMRGISTHHVKTVRQAWRDLLNNRELATPLVCEKLRSDVWRDKPIGPSASYLGVLLALLHELNHEAFATEIERLRAARVHLLHTRTIEMMAKRHGDQVIGKIAGRIPVYISRDVDEPERVFSYVQRWSKTRDLNISRVTRVDIIGFQPEMAYLGKYNFFYDGIVLTWDNKAASIFARWWRKTSTEMTFYHEVGHHHHQHHEGGQIQEQEREADLYKRRMYRNAHPILITIGRVVFLPILLGLKISKHLSKKRGQATS